MNSLDGGPVRFYPVMLKGDLIGYLYATEADDWASFVRRMASPHDTLRAAARWSTRLREGENYGFGPLRALRHWVGRLEDPDAGGIAADAVEGRAPNGNALVELANGTPPPEPASPSALHFGFAWDDDGNDAPRDRKIDSSGYDFLTSGPIRYVPVTRSDEVLGYLWASVTDHAADYLPRKAAGVDGLNAGELWMSRLNQSQVEGLAPLVALRRWVGKPEDHVAGGIAPLVLEQEAPSVNALEELASDT